FKAADGGVAHPITDEKTIYVLQGSLQTTVNGESVTLGAGDLASMPTGMLSNAGAPSDAVVIAWTAGSLTPGAAPAVVRGADVKPGGNDMLVLRRYDFPGNSVRVVTQRKGLKLGPNSAKTDSLIYITSGNEIFMEEGQNFQVTKGDFIREVAGAMHGWDVTEESGFVTTSALPIGAGPIDPDKATDVPK
ncbi:MAG: cupin domain-containing protein, partial [Rhodobacteraceae bacterium]|nr:cupin domain-containing protein [Paracoccaceae bacterium]